MYPDIWVNEKKNADPAGGRNLGGLGQKGFAADMDPPAEPESSSRLSRILPCPGVSSNRPARGSSDEYMYQRSEPARWPVRHHTSARSRVLQPRHLRRLTEVAGGSRGL